MSGECKLGHRGSFHDSHCHPERSWSRLARPAKPKDLRLLFRTCAVLPVLLVLLTSTPSLRAAQKLKDADCLACHGDASLTTDENGRQVSLYVDESKLKHSFHGRLFGCVDCHTDVKSLAHDTAPKKITCAGCHAAAEQAYARSMHARTPKPGGAAGATCIDCHG